MSRPAHRWRRVLFASALAATLSAAWRAAAATRAPRRSAIDGPITGSLDTWPTVPRNAAAPARR
jgi:hypothetical protein